MANDVIARGLVKKTQSEVIDFMSNPVKLMCLYYGYPNNINMVYNNKKASQIYAKYDIVVFGDGCQHPTHAVYNDTVEIINLTRQKNPQVEIFGYVPIGQAETSQKLTIEAMKESVDEWKLINATGIFLDEFGYDYLVSRELQNEIVSYCHSLGMNIIANSWNYDWVFSSQNLYLDWINYYGNPNELPPEINENDYYLFENLFSNIDVDGQKNGSQYRLFSVVEYFQTVKAEYGVTYYDKFHTKLLALDGIEDDYAEKEKLFTMGYLGSRILNIDGYGASVQYWGASESNFIHYNPKKYFELYWRDKHITSYEHIDDVVYSKYSAEFPNASLTLIWKPDITNATTIINPNLGERKLLWNGLEKTNIGS